MIDLFHEFPLSLMTYIALAISFMSFWISTDKRIPFVIFVVSILLGLISNSINFLALISISVFGVLTYLFYQKNLPTVARFFIFLGILILTVLTFLHKVPGYSNWQVYQEVKLSENSASFPFWFNFDKPQIAFFLLLFAYIPASKNTQYREIFNKSFPLLIGLIIALCILGTALQYVVFDPKIPAADITILWVIKMLFFTAIVEEFFFRFFIQNNFIEVFKKFQHGKIIGLVLSSLLFGFFHFSGGMSFVFLAFISGLLYGGAYLRTKYLESAILLHFLVNLFHFLFFSYPYYSKIGL